MQIQVAETSIFDPVAIERLRKVAGEADSGFVAEMAQLFLEETTKLLSELKRGCDESDWKAVGHLSHSLKSSAATLGMMGLSDACVALEIETRSATPGPQTKALVASVLDQFELSVPILKRLS